MSSNLLHVRRPAILRPTAESAQVIATLPGLDGSAWSARSIVHPHALYHIEGEASRRGDGLYDRMGSVGAHEVLLETHVMTAISGMRATPKWTVSASGRAAHSGSEARRRFKYISIFKKSRRWSRAGIRASHFAAHRNHLCAASRPLRTPLRARVFRKQGALRILRHSGAGGAPEPAHGRNSRRLRRLLSLRTRVPTRPGSYPAAMKHRSSAPAPHAWAA